MPAGERVSTTFHEDAPPSKRPRLESSKDDRPLGDATPLPYGTVVLARSVEGSTEESADNARGSLFPGGVVPVFGTEPAALLPAYPPGEPGAGHAFGTLDMTSGNSGRKAELKAEEASNCAALKNPH